MWQANQIRCSPESYPYSKRSKIDVLKTRPKGNEAYVHGVRHSGAGIGKNTDGDNSKDFKDKTGRCYTKSKYFGDDVIEIPDHENVWTGNRNILASTVKPKAVCPALARIIASQSSHSCRTGNCVKERSPQVNSHSMFDDATQGVVSRDKLRVRMAVNFFHKSYHALIGQWHGVGLYVNAATHMKDKWVNTIKRVGPVPGIEIGDVFCSRAELKVIGLHCQFYCGIDYTAADNGMLATSIVSSDRYSNGMESHDVLIYCGEGGNPQVSKQVKNQKLTRGNLALKYSMIAKSPVRVILRCSIWRGGFSLSCGNPGTSSLGYVYAGLFTVDKFWEDRGPFGKLIFKYRLVRISQQLQNNPRITGAMSVLKALNNSDSGNGISQGKKLPTMCGTSSKGGDFVNDISQGKEKIPIPVVKSREGEMPPPFTYIVKMAYPDLSNFTTKGCKCTKRCSDGKCSCAIRNGGNMPYNHGCHITKAKSVFFECGPLCKCPSTCSNKVSQHGIQVPLEIFKTQTKGWGVRPRSHIPVGSFVCEYMGEVLPAEIIEEGDVNNDYLFTLDKVSCQGASEVEDEGNGGRASQRFIIDAKNYGNIGRFINHSCSPNLYTQYVFYDHDDGRMPHVMLFAAKNIPPFQELTMDYNSKIGQGCSAAENLKMNCCCLSPTCRGKIYK